MIREEMQMEALQAWESNRRGIIKVAPRGGKCYIACKAVCNKYKGIIVILPRLDIAEGWKEAFKVMNISIPYIFYTTKSLIKVKHVIQNNFLLILDELHEYSENQLNIIDEIINEDTKDVMALTGTLTKTKERRIIKKCGLSIVYEYSIEQAVKDNILTDYQIIIHRVPLSRTNPLTFKYKGRLVSEKFYFDKISYSISKNSNSKSFLEKKLISILQTSSSKIDKTIDLINKYKDKRLLVFCGQIKIADSLGIPVYHSKTKEKDILVKFCESKGIDKMATCKMLQAGIKIYPIDLGILQYTSGSPEDCAQKICRFLAYEWNKKATIHIICADEPFEVNRITTALEYFDKNKIIIDYEEE